MANASVGALSSLWVEPGASAHTFDSSSEAYEFLSESIQKVGTILDTNGLRGTRSHHSAKTATGPYEVGGDITMNPDPAGLDLWLPRILGAAESNDTFAVADTLPAFGLLIDRVGSKFEYTDCLVNRATFRASQGGLLEMILNIMGRTEVVGTAGSSLPAVGAAANNAPYAMTQGVLTLASGAREFEDFELVIDNAIERKFRNSVTATSLVPTDRIVTLKMNGPFTSGTLSALYAQALAGATGTLVFTNGQMSTTFTFATLQVPAKSPVISGRGEIIMPLEMTARMASTTREIVVTHDSTA